MIATGEQVSGRIPAHPDAAPSLCLRIRYYEPTSGRFNRLDPFAGNAEDPQSLHKYAYVHGDPVNGIDPSGMMFEGFAEWLDLQAQRASAGLSALANAFNLQRVVGTYQSVIAALTGSTGYWLAQWGAYQFQTWLPKIEFAFDCLQVGMAFLDGASELLHDVADSLDELSDVERGRRFEQIAGANLRGNVTGIDDIRFTKNASAFVTSLRSHDVKSPEALLKAIRSDANELFDKSSRYMSGRSSSGRLVEGRFRIQLRHGAAWRIGGELR